MSRPPGPFWLGLMLGVLFGAVLTHAVWIAAYGRPFLAPPGAFALRLRPLAAPYSKGISP